MVAVAALVAFATAYILGIAVQPFEDKPTAAKDETVCTSAGCVLAAATLIQSLSPKYQDIDPCTDFRSFVCEGWDAGHEIRPDQSGIGTLQVMSDDNQLILKRILESPAPDRISLFWTASSPDQEIFDKLHNTYSACMNEALLKSVGSKPLLELLYQLEEKYPANKTSTTKDSSLTSAVEYLMSIGVSGPVTLDVGADDKNPDTNVIALGVPYSFGLPSKQYYNRTEIVKLYKATIGATLEALLKQAHGSKLTSFRGRDSTRILSEELVDEIVSLESRMAAAAPDLEDLQDITKVYNPRTLDEAESYNQQISIKEIIKSFAGDYKPSKVIVASPEYLKSLSSILASAKRETIQAYLAWRIVQNYAGDIEADAVEPVRKFSNILRGQDPDVKPERWKTCLRVVDSDIPWILSRFFVERAFSKESKDLGDKIIYDIKDQFINKLKASEWMTKDVQKLAIDKVGLIRQKIGYPTSSPNITDAGELQKFYKNVNISADAFFNNRLSSTKDSIKQEWEQVNKPVDKAVWGMSASTVNAYYSPPGNEIVFPAGIMQAPVFYDPSIPKYLAYGAFGAVAGHELSHAFDSSGRNYDQNGNYTDWWDDSTINAFKEKAECFVRQYGNYTIDTKDGPLPVNGRLTLGENIADAGGLTAAFQSWRSRDKENADLLLPGLQNFTKEQLFFLAYGRTWCGWSREERAIQLIYGDPHSPPKYRILGTTANSKEFREAFSCPQRKPTCELW